MYFKQRVLFKSEDNGGISYFKDDEEFELTLKPIIIVNSHILKGKVVWFYHLYILNNKTKEQQMFRFWGSIYNYTATIHHKPVEAFNTILNNAESVLTLIFSEQWCDEYGFNYENKSERRKAQQFYKIAEKMVKKFKKVGITDENLFIYADMVRQRGSLYGIEYFQADNVINCFEVKSMKLNDVMERLKIGDEK